MEMGVILILPLNLAWMGLLVALTQFMQIMTMMVLLIFLVLRGAWLADAGAHPNSLLHNNGDGTFTDVTHTSGILSYHPTQTASWADFNLDGYLDLFIGNESNSKWQDIFAKNRVGEGQPHPSELYLNNGDGTFTEISKKWG